MSRPKAETVAYWALTAWCFAGIVSFLVALNAGLVLASFFRYALAAACLALGIFAVIWLSKVPRAQEDYRAQPALMRAVLVLCGPLLIAALSWWNLSMLIQRVHVLAGTDSRATLTVSTRGMASRPAGSSCSHYVRFEETVYPYRFCVTAQAHAEARASAPAQARVKRSPVGFSIEAVQL